MRENYGLLSDRYVGAAASGTLRYGLTDWLTLEHHAEATDSLVLLGGGAAMRIGTLGVVHAALSGSSVHGDMPTGTGGNFGGQVSAGFQRLTRGLSFNLGGTYASNGYSDIAAQYGEPVPKSTLNASLGYQLGRWGNVGVGLVNQVARTGPPGPRDVQVADRLISSQQVSLATLSYSTPVAGRASFYATAFKDLQNDHNYGVAFGVSLALGPTTSASAGGSLDSGRIGSLLTLVKPALAEHDFGYRVQDSEGVAAQHMAEGEFLSSWGRLTGGVGQASGQTSVQGGWSGALVWTDGHLFASNHIDDSFAVVSTGGIAGIPVLYENRVVGTTDSSGHLLVPSLLSYQNNKVAVDTTRLPPDVDAGQTSVVVRPPDRSGVTIDFSIRKMRAALLTLTDGSGKPIPVGSVAKIAGSLDQPVGHEGLTFVSGLRPTNRVQVVLPNGATCSVEFDYTPLPDDIPVIGPLQCQ